MDLEGGAEASTSVRNVNATWNYTLGSMVFFIVVLDAWVLSVIAQSFTRTANPLDAALLVLVLLAAAAHVRCVWFLRVGRGGGLPPTRWIVALVAPAGAAWVVGVFAGDGGVLTGIPLWMSCCLIACLLPGRQRWIVLGLGLVLVVAHPVLSYAVFGSEAVLNLGAAWMFGLYSLLLPAMLFSSLWWWEIVVRLDEYRRTAAELAVAQERLRFAADLHDIQGHHLQVIALKSELAERMLTIDIEAARAHVHDTRVIAKQALEETRMLVAGYREVALADELENAREVLTASGAACTLALDTLPADAELRRVFGLIVREATTNILRHSNAAHVTIRLNTEHGHTVLELENDGVAADPTAQRVPGSGLAGLQERLAALGGELVAESDVDSARFTLTARVPVSAVTGGQS